MTSSREIEARIAGIERRIFELKDEIAHWSDVATDLSLAASAKRAERSQQGRGFAGALFGSKYRTSVRRSAASENASMSVKVAAQRQEITRAKQGLREEERDLRWQMRDLKMELRDARANEKDQERQSRQRQAQVVGASEDPPSPAAPLDVKSELRRLRSMHEAGELDAKEYELARIALLQPHLRE